MLGPGPLLHRLFVAPFARSRVRAFLRNLLILSIGIMKQLALLSAVVALYSAVGATGGKKRRSTYNGTSATIRSGTFKPFRAQSSSGNHRETMRSMLTCTVKGHLAPIGEKKNHQILLTPNQTKIVATAEAH